MRIASLVIVILVEIDSHVYKNADDHSDCDRSSFLGCQFKLRGVGVGTELQRIYVCLGFYQVN